MCQQTTHTRGGWPCDKGRHTHPSHGLAAHTFRSLEALPASSSTSAVRYSAVGRTETLCERAWILGLRKVDMQRLRRSNMQNRCAYLHASNIQARVASQKMGFARETKQERPGIVDTKRGETDRGAPQFERAQRLASDRQHLQAEASPRIAAEYTAAVAPTRPEDVTRAWQRKMSRVNNGRVRTACSRQHGEWRAALLTTTGRNYSGVPGLHQQAASRRSVEKRAKGEASVDLP